ncbi:hypothetical protein OIU74_015164 [Salix koriyanagi]|uniref:Uncharacterized protein n=1 Tax=Salix koriyanagi TaxID=2511006 RepID=A0A9Q0PXH1_9ROSI|nr:hypothetical protein OIU74_015164 [Salix koriyanagi]
MCSDRCTKLFHNGTIFELQRESRKAVLTFTGTIHACKSDTSLVHICKLHVRIKACIQNQPKITPSSH